MQHPRLGELEWETDGWWQGQLSVGGDELAFAVLGDKRGPVGALVDALVATLEHWRETLAKARAYVAKAGKGKVDPEDLIPLSIVFLWSPTTFALELELEGDEEAIWRVEFENGEPKQLGRDD